MIKAPFLLHYYYTHRIFGSVAGSGERKGTKGTRGHNLASADIAIWGEREGGRGKSEEEEEEGSNGCPFPRTLIKSHFGEWKGERKGEEKAIEREEEKDWCVCVRKERIRPNDGGAWDRSLTAEKIAPILYRRNGAHILVKVCVHL